MSTAEQVTAANQLLHMPRGEFRYEMVEGALHMITPACFEHGAIAQDIGVRLAMHVKEHGLGIVAAAETGFLIARDPDTVRAPDVAFVSQTQIDQCGIPTAYFPEAPALAVEVVPPDDLAEEVDSKVRSWPNAGTQLAWVIYPRGRTVTINRSLEEIQVLGEQETLSGEPVVPGFECKIAELFAGLN